MKSAPDNMTKLPSNPNAKKILIVCDEGLNRSATIRGQMQYWGHDCLTVGLNRNSAQTISYLAEWADLIILTAADQEHVLTRVAKDGFGRDKGFSVNVQLWNIGPDDYPRPYNYELLKIVKEFIKEHEDELKPSKA